MSKVRKRKRGGSVILLLLALLLILAGTTALLWLRFYTNLPEELSAPVTTVAETLPETSEETVPETTQFVPSFTADADGNPTSLLCKADYLTEQPDAQAAAAVAGSATLTNEELQVLYLSQVSQYREAGLTPAPDFSLPLASQQCPLEKDISWQHYFLKRALEGWQLRQTMLQAAAQPQVISEEAYTPDHTDTLHAKYIAPELPVNNFLYGNRERFSPNRLHQAYLDGLEGQLKALATEKGYDSVSDYAVAVFGEGVCDQQLLRTVTDYNLSYMYFSEGSLTAKVSEEELAALRESLPGETERLVDVRHILVVPAGGATEEQWDACRQQAEALLKTWKGYNPWLSSPEGAFAQLASEQSQDPGSRLNGGLYTGVSEDQLPRELADWCFDESRKVGDCEVLTSEYGVHLVYLSRVTSVEEEAALRELIQQKLAARFTDRLLPMQVNYGKAALRTEVGDFCLSDLLYPDIGHEHFPEAAVYLQQDYQYSRFGGVYIGSNGCGITTFAMLATYMTDSIQTPAMMGARFPNFQVSGSTDANLFSKAPAEMGFYVDRIVHSIEDVIAALENGQRLISLQNRGVFTTGGHYLLVQAYNPEDDSFQVRDSNIYNYGDLHGHKEDRFSRAALLSGGGQFYVMQPKITTIPACGRCGDQGADVLVRDYTCEKCAAALTRRDAFLSLS